MTKSIFKDNYGESNNKNSVFAFNCYEAEKDLNKFGNDELIKTPFKRCYKKFKTGKLIFRDIDKEMLLKGVNNNNNNNNNDNNSSNYNKKEYERLAKAIEIFKLNRDKEIENEEKEDKDEKENIDEKKENEKRESNNKKEDDNNNEIKRN